MICLKNRENVPEDVQVIGFDGQKMTEGDPYLVSTIAQPTKQMAEVAVAKLIAVINGETVENVPYCRLNLAKVTQRNL